MMADEIRVPVKSDVDIVAARRKGRELAGSLGFSSGDQVLIATSISELARNIVTYAKTGEIILKATERRGRPGIVVIARDRGPGIEDPGLALKDGYSTSRSLGMGLPGVRRLMDEFEITSEIGRGTTVTVRKWSDRNGPSNGWKLS
jgi:serine/threonine-protein kinase RsbT